MAGDLAARFVAGGVIVSVFAVIAEVCRPKSFAGLFSAAPSVALATISITVIEHGKAYSALEARSMIMGAIAFFIYALAASWILMRHKMRALPATALLLPRWVGVALALRFAAWP
jgi:hypothetical protein